MVGRLFALGFGLVLLAGAPAQAGDTSAAEACLRTKVWDGYAEGWGIRTMATTTLNLGGTRNYLVTLYKGNEYKIETCGDDHFANVDVYLYDLAGQVVRRDETSNRQPVITFTPEMTATYYIVLHARELAAGSSDGSVSMAVTYR